MVFVPGFGIRARLGVLAALCLLVSCFAYIVFIWLEEYEAARGMFFLTGVVWAIEAVIFGIPLALVHRAWKLGLEESGVGLRRDTSGGDGRG